jgi:hypothetical protein
VTSTLTHPRTHCQSSTLTHLEKLDLELNDGLDPIGPHCNVCNHLKRVEQLSLPPALHTKKNANHCDTDVMVLVSGQWWVRLNIVVVFCQKSPPSGGGGGKVVLVVVAMTVLVVMAMTLVGVEVLVLVVVVV